MAYTKDKLTQRQENFCQAYIKTGNASQAYRLSYKSDAMKAATVARRAIDVLNLPAVAARIEALRQQVARETVVTQGQVLDGLAAHAFYDPAALVTVSGPQDVAALPPAIRQCIVGWSWDSQGNFVLKLANKTAALEMLGKHLGMFIDRREIRVGELEKLDDAALQARIAQAAQQVAQIEGVDVAALLHPAHVRPQAAPTMH